MSERVRSSSLTSAASVLSKRTAFKAWTRYAPDEQLTIPFVA